MRRAKKAGVLVALAGIAAGCEAERTQGRTMTMSSEEAKVLAFSPGFAAPAERVGKLRFFVPHGTDDRVLGIDACSRRVVPALHRAGYEVTHREFEGGHTVPREIALEAVRWWLVEGRGALSMSGTRNADVEASARLIASSEHLVVFTTGAGISTDSGILPSSGSPSTEAPRSSS